MHDAWLNKVDKVLAVLDCFCNRSKLIYFKPTSCVIIRQAKINAMKEITSEQVSYANYISHKNLFL